MHVRTSCQTVYPVANTIKKLYKRTKKGLEHRWSWRRVLSRFQSIYWLFRTRDSKAKEQKKGEGRADTTLAKRRKKYTIIKTQYIMVNGEGTTILLLTTAQDRSWSRKNTSWLC